VKNRQHHVPPEAKSLSGVAVSGLSWTVVGMVGQLLIQVAVTAVLARQISPAEFGIVGMALVVTGLSQIFSQLGLAPAIVQKSDLAPEEINAARTVSLLLGLFFTLVVLLAAPLIQEITGIPRLTPALRALSAVFAIEALGAVAEATLQRKLEFRALAKVTFSSYVFGYAPIAIALALSGGGIWALVAGTLGASFVRTGLLLKAANYEMGLTRHVKHGLSLARFGLHISLGNVVGYVAGQGDNFVVGTMLGAVNLGIYGRAYKLMAMPATMFGQAIDKVVFPAIASVQNDSSKLLVAFRRGIVATAAVALPGSAIVAVTAPELVRVLLGPSWTGVVPVLRILAVGTFFRVGLKVGDILARGAGRADRILLCKGIYAASVLIFAITGSFFGLNGVASSVGLALGVAYIAFSALGKAVSGLSWEDFARAHIPGLVLAVTSLAITIPIVSVMRSVGVPAVIRLALSVVAGLLAILFVLKFGYGIVGDDVRWWINRVPALGKAMRMRVNDNFGRAQS
jgi:O-antigen/teichoic acid export membrane protein